MNKDGEIIIIEDDSDDQFVIAEIFKKLNYKNTVRFFSDGEKALQFLEAADEIPFLILSDLEMPNKPNGFELRKALQTNARLSIRCIPYLFFTSASNQKSLVHSYSQSVQGFFIKPVDVDELESILKTIIEYWQKCEAPNSF